VEPYVGLVLLGSLLFAVGNVMQKRGIPAWIGSHSVASLARRPGAMLRALVRSPIWLFGLALTAIALGVETQALGQGDVSVVKPLSRMQTVFAVGLAAVLMRERLAAREWLGVAIVVVGAVLLGLEPVDTNVHAPSTAASFATAGGIVLVAALLVGLPEAGPAALRGELGLGLAAGLLFGLGDVMVKAGTEIARGPAGLFDLTQASSAVALLETSQLHLGVFATLAAFLLQQAAFARGRVSVVVPAIGAGGMLVVVLLGVLLLHETLGGERIVAIVVVIAGTALLTPRNAPAQGAGPATGKT